VTFTLATADRSRDTQRLSLSTIYEMRAEVQAFIRRGFTAAEACAIVGLPPAAFVPDSGLESVRWIPTPAEIQAMAERIRADRSQPSVFVP